MNVNGFGNPDYGLVRAAEDGTGGGVGPDVRVALETKAIVESLTPEKRRENLAEMTWLPEGKVVILENEVKIGNKIFQFVTSDVYNQDEAISAGTMRKGDLASFYRGFRCTPEQFTSFCEKVLGLKKSVKYRTSSGGGRRGMDIVSFNEEEGVFMASPDSNVELDDKLPAIFIN